MTSNKAWPDTIERCRKSIYRASLDRRLPLWTVLALCSSSAESPLSKTAAAPMPEPAPRTHTPVLVVASRKLKKTYNVKRI